MLMVIGFIKNSVKEYKTRFFTLQGGFMQIWYVWFSCILPLRDACSHAATFYWMVLIINTMSMRGFDMVALQALLNDHSQVN